MSRETQFIGLTKTAQEYVKDLKEVKSITHTNGMFGEDVPLKRWKAPDEITHFNHPTFITEISQEFPWSAGPMLFTCLRLDVERPEQKLDELDTKFFEWIHDPRVRDHQFDQDKGSLWI